MAISDKLTYLNTTKTLIREGLNNLGASLTSSDTFRSYVNVLSNLYDYLPKVTGSGTNVTLNDTKKGLMKITLDPSELSQSSTPSPSSPETIHSTTGENTITLCSKQLFNKDNPNNEDGFLNGSGEVVYNSTFTTSDYIEISQFSDITISGNAGGSELNCFYDSSKTFISSFGMGTLATKTQSVPNNAVYVRLTIKNSNLNQYMLESGTTASNYEAYKSTNFTIDLGDIEYSAIGTYSDRIFKNISSDPDYDSELDEGAWYIKKNIGKVVFIGSSNENWEKYADGVFRITIANAKEYSWNVLGDIISDKYITITQQQAQGTDYDYGISLRTSITGIVIRNKDYTTTNNFKTYLSTNNTTVYYVLATPTYTKITGTLANQLEAIYNNAMAYEGQTNISQVNNDLPFVINASALQDLSTL